MSQTLPKPDKIDRLLAPVYPAMALMAGMQLEIFTAIAGGAHTTDEIAQALDVNAAKLGPLLYALVAIEVLTVEDGRFANSVEAAHFLVADKPDYRGNGYVTADLWQAVLGTAQTIRSGIPVAKHDYATMSRAELERFMRNLHIASLPVGRDFARKFDFSTSQHVLDAGGGLGSIALAMIEAWPQLRATLADLHTITPIAQSVIREAHADERVDVLAADLVAQPLPDDYAGTFDVAVAKAFIQVLGPADAQRAIRHIGTALKPGGTLYVIGNVLDDSRLSPVATVIANLRFINIYDEGQAYTESEHIDWLQAAGFVDIRIMPFVGRASIVLRRKGRT